MWNNGSRGYDGENGKNDSSPSLAPLRSNNGQILKFLWEKNPGPITPTALDHQGLPFGDLTLEFESQRAELELPPTPRSRPLIDIKQPVAAVDPQKQGTWLVNGLGICTTLIMDLRLNRIRSIEMTNPLCIIGSASILSCTSLRPPLNVSRQTSRPQRES